MSRRCSIWVRSFYWFDVSYDWMYHRDRRGGRYELTLIRSPKHYLTIPVWWRS